MKYRLSPINILIAIALLILLFNMIVGTINTDGGWGLLTLVYLMPYLLAAIAVDYLIQIFCKSYKQILVIEFVVLLVAAFFFLYSRRSKVLVIPDKPLSKYFTIIYGVGSAYKLPVNGLTWRYKITFPENGLLLTSTNYKEDLPYAKFNTISGNELNTKETYLSFADVAKGVIRCGARRYHYKIWKVDSPYISYYTGLNDSFEASFQKILCKERP